MSVGDGKLSYVSGAPYPDGFAKWCKNQPAKGKMGGIRLDTDQGCWFQESETDKNGAFFCEKPADGSKLGIYVEPANGMCLRHYFIRMCLVPFMHTK